MLTSRLQSVSLIYMLQIYFGQKNIISRTQYKGIADYFLFLKSRWAAPHVYKYMSLWIIQTPLISQ